MCPSFRASRQRWPRSGQHGSAGREAGRTAVSDDHARPRTTTHGRRTLPRTTAAHDHARPCTTTHDRHARPRTTAHDRAQPRTTAAHDHSRSRTTTHNHARPRTTAHDRPRLPYLFEEAVPTPPQGGFGHLGG